MNKFRSSPVHDLYEKSGYPGWLKMVTVVLVSSVQKLRNQINQTDDVTEQNKLLSQQNTQLSYLIGLSIGVDTNDKTILDRLKGRVRGRG